MPYLLALAAGALVGAAAVFKTSSTAKRALDSAGEMAERIEKPALVLASLATVWYFSKGR